MDVWSDVLVYRHKEYMNAILDPINLYCDYTIAYYGPKVHFRRAMKYLYMGTGQIDAHLFYGLMYYPF